MTQQNWFNLNISGLGYVNRIREVKPKKGEAFLCCDIAALRGPSDDVEYQRFDCRVTGKEAQQLIRRCVQACKEKRKVLIQFRLGDLYTETFVYMQGERQGQTGVSLKAHLLFIGMIKVEGELVYQAKPRDSAEPETPESNESQPVPVNPPVGDDLPAKSAPDSSTPSETPAAPDDSAPGTKANDAASVSANAAGIKHQSAENDAELACF